VPPLPQQIEFARLNLTYVVLSKRKLIQLVDDQHVNGWDDPRLPTLVGARRRGYTAEGFRLFAEMIGVYQVRFADRLQRVRGMPARGAQRTSAPRAHRRARSAEARHRQLSGRHRTSCARRPTIRSSRTWASARCRFAKELWIEREDFVERRRRATSASFPATRCACATASSSTCTGCDKDAAGNVTAVHCNYFADSKSGTPGADNYKVKGNIHWVSARHALSTHRCASMTACSVPNPGAETRLPR
jgi:glutaminyl-tRNA synthetase